MAKQRALICPYCGKMQAETDQCRACSGFLDPMSRQATHNAMGPWFMKEDGRGFHPGCSYETMVKLIERGDITRHTIVRGPTTRQFWTIAKRVPCLSHLLGFCHACDTSVDPGDHGCHACGVKFGAYLDRNYMGLPEVRPLPWEADVEGDVAQVGPRIDVPEEMRRDWSAQGEGAGSSSGGRLSSFATDDELTGSGEFAHVGAGDTQRYLEQDAGDGTSQATATAPAAQRETSPSAASTAAAEPNPAATPATFDTGIATRSLQRRLRANTRTIQRLWLALTVSVIANAMLLLGWQAGWFDVDAAAPDSTEQAQSTDQSSQQADDASSAAPPAVNENARTLAGAGSSDDPNEMSRDASPATSDTSEPGKPAVVYADDEAGDENADAAEQMIAGAMERVDALVKSAKKEERKLEDRIKDYEKAIAILTPIVADHADIAGEMKLSQRIADYEREAERLRLRVFFP